jgi:hypothetical protein
MRSVASIAENVRAERKPASDTNPFLGVQAAVSEQIVRTLDTWRDAAQNLSEQAFMAIYGSPILQAAVGVDAESARPRRPGKSPAHRELVERRIAELKAKINQGGLVECAIRGLLYAGASRGAVDERGVEALRRIRATSTGTRLTLSQFKQIAREQFFLLLLEPEATLAAIPKLLPADVAERKKGLAAIRTVLSAIGDITGETAERLKKVESLFGLHEAAPDDEETEHLPTVPPPVSNEARHRAKRH